LLTKPPHHRANVPKKPLARFLLVQFTNPNNYRKSKHRSAAGAGGFFPAFELVHKFTGLFTAGKRPKI